MSSIHPYTTDTGQRRYRVAYRRPDGRWTSKRGFARKIDAQAWLEHQAVAMRSGEWIDPKRGKVTIRELGEAWLAGRTDVKPSWHRSLEIAWRKHVEPAWGARQVDSIGFGEIQEWVSGQTHSATTTKRNHGVLMQILDDAVRDKRIASNPAKGVRLPRKVAAERHYLTAQQLHRLAEASSRPTLVLLLGYVGLRWGEAIALRVMDFDATKRRLTIRRNAVLVGGQWRVGTPKTHKARSVILPAPLAARVAIECRSKLPAALIFPGPSGDFLQPPVATRSWWLAARDAAGLPGVTPHDLRHTAASLAISSGASVKAVQRMLGHASAAVTLDTYSTMFDDDLEALAERLSAVMASQDLPDFCQPGDGEPDAG